MVNHEKDEPNQGHNVGYGVGNLPARRWLVLNVCGDDNSFHLFFFSDCCAPTKLEVPSPRPLR